MLKQKRIISIIVLVVAMSMLFVPQSAAQNDSWRTIEFETDEVTLADVTVSPDGQHLIFTMLGHLFLLSTEGGKAEQVTFGPYYDADPVFSPDGNHVAFVSDRDGSEGNVYVLDLTSKQATQITRESWAGRPCWSPDGQRIIYLSFLLDKTRNRLSLNRWIPVPAIVKQVAMHSGETEIIQDSSRLFRSLFHLPNGRLGWNVVRLESQQTDWTTLIEVVDPEGTVSTLKTIEGYVDRVVAGHKGKGFFYRHFFPGLSWQPGFATENIYHISLTNNRRRPIFSMGASFISPRFAVSRNDDNLFVSNGGRIWKVVLPRGMRKQVEFSASVRIGVQNPVSPKKWAPAEAGTTISPSSIRHPRLSPDGKIVVFEAAGYLWQQSVSGGLAHRLLKGNVFESDPAFSPDAKYLAYVSEEYDRRDLRVLDLATGQVRGFSSGYVMGGLTWSPDSQQILFEEWETFPSHLAAVSLSDGEKKKIMSWRNRSLPQLSSDGQTLFFTANLSGTQALYGMPFDEKAKPVPITDLTKNMRKGIISSDGRWLAFQRGLAIWVAPMGVELIKEEDVRFFSEEGGGDFCFTPDNSALIYSAGSHIWRQPLPTGERQEIPVRLNLHLPVPPPLLLRNVRPLDFEIGSFGCETSIFIEDGRIRWIGDAEHRSMPSQTLVLDGGGRFAIPGLFDMHVHLGGGISQDAFLAYGVTSVRNTGDSLAWMNSLSDYSQATRNPVPRYFFSGLILQSSRVAGDIQIQNEEEASAYIRKWKEWGSQFIKVYDNLPWNLQHIVAQEARLLSLPVVGHGLTAEQVIRRTKLGFLSLEHSVHSSRLYDDVLQLMAQNGTHWDPTLTMHSGTLLTLRNEPERLNNAKVKTFMPEWCAPLVLSSLEMNGGERPMRGDWVEQLAGILAAHHRGVKLHAGTDLQGSSWTCFPGLSLHWELEHFVESGIEPLDVLRIATLRAAELVGGEDHLGSLEIGKLADIVLLDANPLENIKNTQSIWRVIKGGWMFDPGKVRQETSHMQ